MNILFINANLYGHINPTLGLVNELTKRGNQVSYFCAEPFSEIVPKMGANWIGFSDKLEVFLREYHPTDRHPFFICNESYTCATEDACTGLSSTAGPLL